MMTKTRRHWPCARNRKTARESARQIPAGFSLNRLPPPGNRKPAGDVARQIEPLPSRSRRHLDYESFRLAESEQILPLIGNRKPASDRGHWLQPVPCSSRRRSCPGGERGDRQSSVPAEPPRHGQG